MLFSLPLPTKANTLPTSLSLKAGDYSTTLSAQDLTPWFRLQTELRPGSRSRSEVENTEYCPMSTLYCTLYLSRYTRQHFSVSFQSKVDEESIKSFVSDIVQAVNQEPQDAVFGVGNDNTVIVSQREKTGRTLDENSSVDLLFRALGTPSGEPLSIALPTALTAPKIVGSDKERLGLKELIGEGHTNFQGSPKNRIFNITRALKQFQNILIAPNEKFSFVTHLGDVDGEHGYLPELVIKNNKTEPEFGGGICQVSTTVFRAAIYSGMKIVDRRNHAYPVRYYTPYGMDATIYIPKPDLTFINNTPGYVLVTYTIEGNLLTFRFFGTNDGRATTVDGPHILERGGDGSMKTVFTQEVTAADGKNFIRDSFWSNYKSPSLFPHPGQEPNFTTKPADWSEKQWKEYKATHP